jgi:hypothetical protein
MRSTKHSTFGMVALTAILASVMGPRPVRAQGGGGDDLLGRAARANEHTIAMEYDQARAELAKADPEKVQVVLAKARLAIYEEDCDLAAALLSRGEAAQTEEGRGLADIARGCARVTSATAVSKDDASGVVLRFQDDADAALAPMLVDTVKKARVALARDLGVEFKAPIRITMVRDLLSLSAMTGLPYKSAQTTGTVAVAKWGRVTILSPRASTHGYPFRDTLTHELTHLAISMQSRERAPLWLHEGVARRQETRWREPGPFDERPTPESIVLRGMELKLDLALDKLGPSIAMLPSADAATVAFAEVTSFVKYFVESSGNEALPKLLFALRSAKSVDDALKSVSGDALAAWDVKWRAQLQKRGKEPLSPLYGLGAIPPGMGDSRERARLAELLLARGHGAQAVVELDKIPENLLGDPSLRYLRGRALETDGKAKDAEPLVFDPKAWVTSYGPCWALRGRLARSRSDIGVAVSSFEEARAHDPLSVESACEALGDAEAGALPPSALCAAARARAEPDLGRD